VVVTVTPVLMEATGGGVGAGLGSTHAGYRSRLQRGRLEGAKNARRIIRTYPYPSPRAGRKNTRQAKNRIRSVL